MSRKITHLAVVAILIWTALACGATELESDIEAKVEAAVSAAIADLDIEAIINAAVSEAISEEVSRHMGELIAQAFAQGSANETDSGLDETTQGTTATPSVVMPTATPLPTFTPTAGAVLVDQSFVRELGTRYKANPLRLERQLEEPGTHYEISGAIESIEKYESIRNDTFTITVTGHFYPYTDSADVVAVYCRFNEADSEALIEYSVGGNIRMGGAYSRLMTWGNELSGLFLEDCQVLS